MEVVIMVNMVVAISDRSGSGRPWFGGREVVVVVMVGHDWMWQWC